MFLGIKCFINQAMNDSWRFHPRHVKKNLQNIVLKNWKFGVSATKMDRIIFGKTTLKEFIIKSHSYTNTGDDDSNE